MTDDDYDFKDDLMCRLTHIYLKMFNDWKNADNIPDAAVRKYVKKILDKRMRQVLEEMRKLEANEVLLSDLNDILEREDDWIDVLVDEDSEN